MPDWSYHPFFRPLLFCLPVETARNLTLKSMGTLARLPLGPLLIETMGHMSPPPPLKRQHWGISFPSPVGLGAGLDTEANALSALAKFGFGYLELGPVLPENVTPWQKIERLTDEEAILYPEPGEAVSVDRLLDRLQAARLDGISLGARLGVHLKDDPAASAEVRVKLAEKLAPYCRFFTLDSAGVTWDAAGWREHLQLLSKAIPHPLLLVVPPDLGDDEWNERLLAAADSGILGVVVAGGMAVTGDAPGRLTGQPTFERSLLTVQYIRRRWKDRFVIIGSGGIMEPADALAMLEAGASFIQLHSGLVYAGPGLPKRINEAILQTNGAEEEFLHPVERPRFNAGWLYSCLLGIGMIVGGALAWLVAVTAVVLPYDEAFLGMTRAEIRQINERLLLFMSHDRISLAGTMISIGIIYLQLSLFGLRERVHWTRQVLLVSGSVGFSSFFLFIGYGYFDRLHAILSFILLPLFILAVRTKADKQLETLPPQLHNDRYWHRALWGQLCFVIIGFGLTVAGLAISLIGITRVFVPEDLAYLCATPEMLRAINERLIPLIAHDRAGFGGALVSDGLAVLLISLWGFRLGARWIWWMLLFAGIPGFASGIGIHYAVGYTDFWHLFPAFVAFLFFLAGLVLSYPYLCYKKKAGA
jgi:dihydroorotate dehydrogenase